MYFNTFGGQPLAPSAEIFRDIQREDQVDTNAD